MQLERVFFHTTVQPNGVAIRLTKFPEKQFGFPAIDHLRQQPLVRVTVISLFLGSHEPLLLMVCVERVCVDTVGKRIHNLMS